VTALDNRRRPPAIQAGGDNTFHPVFDARRDATANRQSGEGQFGSLAERFPVGGGGQPAVRIDVPPVLISAHLTSVRVQMLSIHPILTRTSIQPSHFDRIAKCFEISVPKMEFDDRTGFVGCADCSAPPTKGLA
jgi:hypothetical protein